MGAQAGSAGHSVLGRSEMNNLSHRGKHCCGRTRGPLLDSSVCMFLLYYTQAVYVCIYEACSVVM